MTSLGVPFDHFFERFLAAIVHVGGSLSNVAYRRSFESAFVLFFTRLLESAKVRLFRIHADTQIVVQLVGKIGPHMANRAVCFVTEEERAATNGRLANGVFFARLLDGHVFVVKFFVFFLQKFQIFDVVLVGLLKIRELLIEVPWCRTGNERSLEAGDGLADILDAQAIFKNLVELLLIARDPSDDFHSDLVGVAHLDGISNRTDRLIFKRCGAAIPKLRSAEDTIVGRG
jgi:hypothetical protein